jgi:aspartate carbamoyltransferase catalytic subunit
MIDPKKPALYQLIVVAGDGNLAFPEAQAFLDSLTFSK